MNEAKLQCGVIFIAFVYGYKDGKWQLCEKEYRFIEFNESGYLKCRANHNTYFVAPEQFKKIIKKHKEAC